MAQFRRALVPGGKCPEAGVVDMLLFINSLYIARRQEREYLVLINSISFMFQGIILILT